ncbi:hypothetical protein GGR52DRAFT_197402 [Hypoxylon sp. FL1284]|nr:hypothetical protein GGR52DRAFT_197402 [Hypoxylon sp. FL1284]
MDWPMEDATWTEHDFRNFEFQTRPTVVLRKSDSDLEVVRQVLRNKEDWEHWFDSVWIPSHATKTEADILRTQAPSVFSKEPSGLSVVLCSRAPPVFEGEDAPISYISISRDTWQRLTRAFHIHRSIIRSIARRAACVSSFYEEGRWSNAKIYFTARMSTYLPGDLALSVTYVPSTESTFAVLYGCNEQQKLEIEKRIRAAGDRARYPVLLLGLLAELERERLVSKADDLIDGFTLRSDHLENRQWNPSKDMSNEKTQEYLTLCLHSRSLVDHIKAVKRQMFKLMAEIDEFGCRAASYYKSEVHPGESKKARRFKQAGALTKKRLQDIVNEYDGKVDECDMIVGNTTLAMQTVWNEIARRDSDLNTRIAKENTAIALEAKREGTQMRAIALLTMIYLPFSSVAGVFSMGVFDWQAQDGSSVVTRYFWVFAVLAVGLTAITLSAWYFITLRHRGTPKKDTLELHSKIV